MNSSKSEYSMGTLFFIAWVFVLAVAVILAVGKPVVEPLKHDPCLHKSQGRSAAGGTNVCGKVTRG